MRKDSAFNAFAAKAPAAYPAFAPAAAPLYPHADQSIDTAYRTHFGQHHNLNAPVARALRILESSSIWSAIALTCITLSSGIPASSSTRRAESARSPERFQLL